MQLDNNTKKAILVFGAAALIFWYARPKLKSMAGLNTSSGESNFTSDTPVKREHVKEPTMHKRTAKANPQAAQAFKALRAYILAYNAGESQKNLDTLNKELGKEMAYTVSRRPTDGKFVVSDLKGRDILVHNE